MAPHDDDKRTCRPDGDEESVSVSRRSFLKTVSAGPIAAGVLAPGTAAAQSGPSPVGPGAVPISLDINGQVHSLEVEPRVTLLDAMRTRLDVTGQKRVCDRGSCGACTVVVDGRTVYACSVLAIEMQGKPIRTVEGLAEGTVLHPVQQAFCDSDGLMCGFCTPGFVMSAVALLERSPNPSAAEAKAALDGNICRCGTYPRVLEAVLNTKGVRRG
jgi:xanthine dehydrogenase YagT iron-sulfur-binding subunit